MLTFSQSSSLDLSLDESKGVYDSSLGIITYPLAISTGKQAYADIIADELRTIKGEVLLDPERGVDYMGTVFKSVTRLNIWKHYVTKTVEVLPFVANIISFDASYSTSTKVLTYKLVVLTDDGTVEVES